MARERPTLLKIELWQGSLQGTLEYRGLHASTCLQQSGKNQAVPTSTHFKTHEVEESTHPPNLCCKRADKGIAGSAALCQNCVDVAMWVLAREAEAEGDHCQHSTAASTEILHSLFAPTAAAAHPALFHVLVRKLGGVGEDEPNAVDFHHLAQREIFRCELPHAVGGFRLSSFEELA